jgi:hypothetical protein
VIVTLSLTACATVPSRPVVVFPPVAAYDRAFQARLADEIQRLPYPSGGACDYPHLGLQFISAPR